MDVITTAAAAVEPCTADGYSANRLVLPMEA